MFSCAVATCPTIEFERRTRQLQEENRQSERINEPRPLGSGLSSPLPRVQGRGEEAAAARSIDQKRQFSCMKPSTLYRRGPVTGVVAPTDRVALRKRPK